MWCENYKLSESAKIYSLKMDYFGWVSSVGKVIAFG